MAEIRPRWAQEAGCSKLQLQKNKNECATLDPTMWKNILILLLLGVLVCLWSDLVRFFERVAMRDVVMLLLVLGTIGAVTFIGHVVRRL